jgi:hypothetical protein
MTEFTLALGVLAGLVQLAGYWQYHRIMASDVEHSPNAASWLMWGVGGLSELIIYAYTVDNRDKEILPAVCAAVALIMFIRVWRRANGLHLDRHEWHMVALDMGLVAFWFVTRNLLFSNLFLALDMYVSFRPVLKHVRENPRSEHPEPWKTWTIAYSLLTLLVVIQWEGWLELIYPVTYLILHGLVWRRASMGRRLNTAVV